MNREKFNALIDRLEVSSRQRPAAYRLRVAALAALGYGYLFAVVLALLLLIAAVLFGGKFNFLTIKVAGVILVLIGIVLRSMWVTLPEPDGRELQRDNAPKLFDLINEVRTSLRGPTVYRVFISDEFNAFIVQIPQLGMFGWVRNYLVVGLPLLNALTPEEFRAVLAHEFGHLSGKHGRFSAWIYRVRQTWITVLTTVHEERHYASFLFEPFLKWYAPFFNAYSFVLARRQEYEADGYAVELAGRRVAARTLVRMRTKDCALAEDFWPKFLKGANEEKQPPKDPFVRMLAGVALAVDRHQAEKWFLQSLQKKTDYDDTHPALADRLIGIGYEKESLTTPAIIAELVETEATTGQSAADTYLRDLPEGAVPSFERLLRERIVPTWRERHQFIQQSRQRLDALTSRELLTEAELWEQAGLLTETQDDAASLPSLKAIINNNPDHARANYAVGAILLQADDAGGVKYLEKAIAIEPIMTEGVCELLYHFHRRQGREQEANDCRSRGEQYAAALTQHYQTAFKLSRNDHFEPHGLDNSELAEIQNQLSNTYRLGEAFLVRKILDDDQKPIFVFGIVSNYAWHDFHTQEDSAALMHRVGENIRFPRKELVYFLMLEREDKFLREVFGAIPGAQIFPPATHRSRQT
jgi:Zn-dependent protease with chaperone function